MLALFLRHRKPIFLLLAALLGLAGGQLAGTLTRVGGAAGSSPPKAMTAARAAVKPADPAEDLAFILQHNPFDPAARTTTPAKFTLRHDSSSQGTTAAPGDLELRGTVVAGGRSLAMIRSGQEIRLYRLGEEIPGSGTLEAVSRHEVRIRNSGLSLTTLSLFEGDSPTAAGTQPSREARAGLSGTALRSAGQNRWIIPRGEVEAIRENFGEQLGMALMQPHIVNGRTDGFIIKRIAPGALLGKMGLIRGDVVKQVNEMAVDSPDKALQILQQLREARQLTVAIERNGTPLTFNYEID